jgi:hypothetical protein
MTLALRLYGEDPRSLGPECAKVMHRLGPEIKKALSGAVETEKITVSNCCGTECNETDLGLCPSCLEHCDFEEVEQ